MRERVHVNRTMKDLVADLRLMKSVLLSQYMPFLFAQRQEIGFPSRTEIDVPSPKTTQQWLGWTVVSPPQWALLTVMFLFQYFIYLSFVKLSWQNKDYFQWSSTQFIKKRGFAKIQNNDEPSTPTGVELQVTAHDTMCGSKCLPNPRPQRRSNLSTDYMVRPRWGRMYRSHLAIRKSLTLRLTGVRPFSGSVCLHTFILHKRLNSNIKSVYILQRIYLLCSY